MEISAKQKFFDKCSCRRSAGDVVLELCSSCLDFVNQDFVPQRETPMPGATIDKIDPSTFPFQIEYCGDRPQGIPELKILISEGRLTPSQAKVVKLRCEDGKSFSEIGESLGISKSCAHKHFERAVRNGKKRLTFSGWLKDLGFLKPSPPKIEIERCKSESAASHGNSFQHQSKCSECSNFWIYPNSSNCVCCKCGWNVFVEPNFHCSDQLNRGPL